MRIWLAAGGCLPPDPEDIFAKRNSRAVFVVFLGEAVFGGKGAGRGASHVFHECRVEAAQVKDGFHPHFSRFSLGRAQGSAGADTGFRKQVKGRSHLGVRRRGLPPAARGVVFNAAFDGRHASAFVGE